MDMMIIPCVVILIIAMIMVGTGAFFKFVRRDEVAEKAIEEMVVSHRRLQSEATAMQNKANAMKSLIQDSIDRLPRKSQQAISSNPVMLSKN